MFTADLSAVSLTKEQLSALLYLGALPSGLGFSYGTTEPEEYQQQPSLLSTT